MKKDLKSKQNLKKTMKTIQVKPHLRRGKPVRPHLRHIRGGLLMYENSIMMDMIQNHGKLRTTEQIARSLNLQWVTVKKHLELLCLKGKVKKRQAERIYWYI